MLRKQCVDRKLKPAIFVDLLARFASSDRRAHHPLTPCELVVIPDDEILAVGHAARFVIVASAASRGALMSRR